LTELKFAAAHVEDYLAAYKYKQEAEVLRSKLSVEEQQALAAATAPPPPPPPAAVPASSNPISKLMNKVRGNKEVKQPEPAPIKQEPRAAEEPGKPLPQPQKPATGFGVGISSEELLSRVFV
jgi:hypothetical protein